MAERAYDRNRIYQWFTETSLAVIISGDDFWKVDISITSNSLITI